MCDVPLRSVIPQSLDSDADEESLQVLSSCPDLQGLALLPSVSSSGSESRLVRMDFMGDLSIDCCSLFRTGAPQTASSLAVTGSPAVLLQPPTEEGPAEPDSAKPICGE